MANNPTNYIPNIARVSQIVEFMYPFHGESRDRFHSWLEKHQISLAEYMEEASTGGTYVHLAMETYGKEGKWKGKKYKEIVNNGIQFHKDYNINTIASEVYVSCEDYQGTCDRIAEIDGVKWILDWKTYGLAKYKFGLEGTYRKPYDKLKKARLQLSLYARLLDIDKIGVVELEKDGYHFHPLELTPEDEIQEILLLYKNNYIDEL